MFSAYCNGKLFYWTESPLMEYKVINPTITKEENKADIFTFTMGYNNVAYDTIECLVSWIEVYRDDELWFEGYATNEKTDFYKQKTITCEGSLALLARKTIPNSTNIFGTIRQEIDYILEAYNSKVTDDREKFYVGAVTVQDANISDSYIIFTYDTAYNYIMSIVEQYGGHLMIRYGDDGKRYLDYYKEYPRTSAQEISFGRNLLDYTKNYDRTSFATVVVPLGMTKTEAEEKKKELNGDTSTSEEITDGDMRIDISSVNDGVPYLVSEAAETYGWIEKVVIFDDIYSESDLKAAGEDYLKNIQFDDMSLEVTAFDLSFTNTKEEV